MFTQAGLPRIRGRVDVTPYSVHVSSDNNNCEILSDGREPADVGRIISRLDGKTRISDIARAEPNLSGSEIAELLGALDQAGLIDDDEPAEAVSGQDLI